jgi:tetratricopeptide (TPR) repeat protein
MAAKTLKTNVSQNQRAPSPGRLSRWAIVGVLIFTALLYCPAIFNGFTDMDDDSYILKNPFLRDFTVNGVKAIFTSFYASNYHPLTTLAYLFEFHFFKLDPLPYHLLNVALHLLNTWLVYVLAARLSGKKTTALVVSVLFAVHPVHVESVAWVSELKDVLYAFFYLASLLFYLRYLSSGFKKGSYLIALLLFIASLLSKPAAVTLPLLLIAVDIYKGRALAANAWIEKIPFFALSILFGILNILAQKAGGPVVLLFSAYGFINGFFLLTSGIAAYLIMCVAPVHLSAIHYFPIAPGGTLPWSYYLSLPLLLATGWLAAKKSLWRKEILSGIAFFLITISVMLQIVSAGEAYFAERYSYVAYIGLFYIAGQWMSGLKDKNKVIARVLFSFVVVLFSIQTWYRIPVWKNSEVLFTDVIDKNPDIEDINFIYLSRANYRGREGDLPGAADDYTKAIGINPSFAFEYAAYYGRGHIYDLTGDLRSALADYTRSISLNPKYADVYNARGWDYFQTGDATSALHDLNSAIALNPSFGAAYNNRGWLYYRRGNAKQAMLDFSEAIGSAPGFDKPYYNRALIFSGQGSYTSAIADYNTLVKLTPDSDLPYYLRGVAHLNLKDTAAACQDWSKAGELGNTQARQMIGLYCH